MKALGIAVLFARTPFQAMDGEAGGAFRPTAAHTTPRFGTARPAASLSAAPDRRVPFARPAPEVDSPPKIGEPKPLRPFSLADLPPILEDWRTRLRDWAEDVDLVPDLGQNIGSLTWFRGAATCFGLCFAALALTPDFAPLPASSGATMTASGYDELRSQMITPLAYGADSGRHMGPNERAAPLASTPERPSVTLNAAIGAGDSFPRALARAGVSAADAQTVLRLVGPDLRSDGEAGTRLAITLGRRPNRSVPRPLMHLAFRARLDLAIDIARTNGALTIRRTPIAIDTTPLRIRGVVTDSLYRAARGAGAAPASIQAYLRVIGQQISLDRISPGDRFDIIVAHRRAATGESETGDLLYGGLRQAGGRTLEMLKWAHDGKTQWFEASGVGEKRGGLSRPIMTARLSSGFGMRFHPILGYSRMHAGVDFAAPSGTPIYAVTDGVVAFAGRHGGHGNFVKLAHNGGLGTGYAHMSRIAVSYGQRVRRGQVIGYVGSTGLSTGPHLHYEVYRGGQTVNPLSVRFEQASLLAGRELLAFRTRLAELKARSSGPAMAAPSLASGEPRPARLALR